MLKSDNEVPILRQKEGVLSVSNSRPVTGPWGVRHLRLVTEESSDDTPGGHLPWPGTRPLKGRLPTRPPAQGEVEIPISRSTDLSIGSLAPAPHPTDDFPCAAGQPGFAASCERMSKICQRIAEGYYNSPEVLDAVARRIVCSGALRGNLR